MGEEMPSGQELGDLYVHLFHLLHRSSMAQHVCLKIFILYPRELLKELFTPAGRFDEVLILVQLVQQLPEWAERVMC